MFDKALIGWNVVVCQCNIIIWTNNNKNGIIYIIITILFVDRPKTFYDRHFQFIIIPQLQVFECCGLH